MKVLYKNTKNRERINPKQLREVLKHTNNFSLYGLQDLVMLQNK